MLAFWWALPREVVPDLPDDVAHDWFGLGTWALIVFGFVVCAVLIYRIKQGVDETNKQVKNGHRDPLRTDVDRIIAQQTEILTKLDDHGSQLGDMRDEVRVERRERREDVADLRKDFTRKLSDLAVQIEQK